MMKLSELMSYLLYDTDNDTACLLEEINYIKNYIDLESLRFEQPPEVNFEIQVIVTMFTFTCAAVAIYRKQLQA
ncbi:hypothetical protein CS542_08385 [Pedobacter sp. IW39]|nr:hypothetical protein CS542_08385 [Pedobacter sp. IW39]